MKTPIDFKFESSNIPKYIQIADYYLDNIIRRKLKSDDKIPSINEFSKINNCSRDTVEKGYKILKEKRAIKVIKGKGTYIDGTRMIDKLTVLFLINKLSTYKLEMYDSFCKNISSNFHCDFEIYNCDEILFNKILEKHKNSYDYYIIMPHFKLNTKEQNNFNKESLDLIKRIPCEKLIIMDNNELKIEGEIIEIYQDFEKDIFNTLKGAWYRIRKYKKINLVLSNEKSYSYLGKIKKGFLDFCLEYLIRYSVVNQINENTVLNKGDLFIVIDDDDLVALIDLAKAKDLVFGKDIGIISYNETPLKRLLGIAVMSTNFIAMGKTAAQMIMDHTNGRVKNPFNFIDRPSI